MLPLNHCTNSLSQWLTTCQQHRPFPGSALKTPRQGIATRSDERCCNGCVLVRACMVVESLELAYISQHFSYLPATRQDRRILLRAEGEASVVCSIAAKLPWVVPLYLSVVQEVAIVMRSRRSTSKHGSETTALRPTTSLIVSTTSARRIN